MLGKEGQGWEIVSSALVNERSGSPAGVRCDQTLEWLVKTAKGQGVADDPNVASGSRRSPSRARS
jgi:hypothetical protein